MAKAIFVLRKLYELTSVEMDPVSVQKVCNLCHFPDRKVRDEVALFLLTISSEFDDPGTLLEVQKFNLSRMNSKLQEGEDIKIEINFVNEPRKSKKQLTKLVKIAKEYCRC